MGETLEQRIEKAADDARRTWLSTADTIAPWEVVNEGDKADWRNVVRPLVERIVELERTQQRSATDSEREMAEMRDKLTAAQTAGRDQASELEKAWAAVGAFKADAERLKGALADANEVIKDERETVRKLLSDNAALETTVDVLAGRLAARGQS